MKKIIVLSMIICQLAVSCSSGSDGSNAIDNEIASLLQKPYSSLTPDQQKVKLENEANSMLLQMESSKSSTALDAIENFGRLLSISEPSMPTARKAARTIQEILNISDFYGVFTWNPNQENWTFSPSTTELKFIFPASPSLTTNNAELTAQSISSGVKVVIDTQTGDQLNLPSSVNAILKIGGVQVGAYEANAVYSNGDPPPVEVGYKLTLNGYVWENYAKRTTPISVKSSFSYNGKNLIDFNVGSTADIDKLMEGSELTQYLGKANCLISLMDDFVMAADMNIEGLANDENALYINTPEPDYNNPTAVSAYNKTFSEGEANAFNKNVKMALVSKKDGTKLADVVLRSVRGDINYYDEQEYNTNLYLRFSDSSEVAMDVYFSSGFDNLATKFKDFINSFNQ
jgi:hypothetical protein